MSDSGTAALKSESQNRPPPPPPKDDPSRGSASKAAPTAPAKTLPTRGPATPPRPSVAPRRIPSGRALSLSPERPADKPRPAATNATKSRLPPPTVVTSTAKPPLVPSDKPVFDPAILSDASASPDDEDRLALDYLAELGKASGPLPGRRGSSGPPSPWTPHESGPSAGTATVGELQKTEMVASPPGSPVPSGTPSRDELGQPVQDKIYPDTGGVERLAELNMDNILATMHKLGIKKQSRLAQRQTLKDFATEMDVKISDQLRIVMPYIEQSMGNWRMIDPLPFLPAKIADNLRGFLLSFKQEELVILYKDTLYAAITGERLDIKCEHARSCATTRRLLVRLIETIVPEVLYHVISAEDPAHDGQVLKQVLKKAGQSGMDDTLGGYLAWAMSNQRAELVSSPVTDKGGKLLALLLPPRTISCYLESFLDRTVDGLGGGPDAVPAWLHLIGETTVVCLAQLNAAGTRQIVYKTRGHVQLETFEGLVKRVGEWRKERAKAGGRSAVKPKKGEKPAKDPIRLLLSIYEGMKGALFPLATVERGSGAPPFASRLILMGDETEVPQTKLFESWFRAQNSSQAVPFLAHEYQSLVLALLSNRNEPGTYLAWTKLAADDWSGNGAWISYLDSVARSRSVRSSDGSVPSDKDRWMALDKTRLRYAIEGFSNSAALELDDLSRRKRQGISLTKEDSVRRRQIEATKQSIVSLLGAFPRRGSVILSLLKFALRLLFILVVVIFFASVLTTAFPWLTRIRLRKDAPLVVDLQECRGIHGRSWCWAKDKAGVVFEASRQGLSSIVEPVYEPIYEAHVKPVYDEYALPLVRRAGQYLPKVQEAVSPFATVAGAGVVYGVKWLEEAVDAIVQSGKDMDWQRLYSATARVASGTVDVAGRASVEIWAAAKPLVVSSAERTREAVGDAYLRLMRVPSIAEAAAKFDQHVGQPSGKLWTQVKPRLQHAAELGRKGTKMAYLVIVRKQPKSPDETWESKIETESFVRDVGAAWTWSKEKAAASMDPALDNLASVHQATKEGWHKFVSWLEDSVGLEFGEWEDEIEVGFSDDEDDEEPASDPLSPPLVTEASTADVGDSGKVDGQDVGTVKSDADKGAEEQGVEQGQSEEQVQEERTGEPQIAVPMDEPDSSSEQESAGADSAHVASQQFDNVASEPERRPFEDVEVVTESAEHDFAEPASSDSSDQERVHTSDQGESIPPPKSEAEDGILDEDSMGQMGTEAEAGVVGHGQGDHDTQSVPAATDSDRDLPPPDFGTLEDQQDIPESDLANPDLEPLVSITPDAPEEHEHAFTPETFTQDAGYSGHMDGTEADQSMSDETPEDEPYASESAAVDSEAGEQSSTDEQDNGAPEPDLAN